jgi:hypothetical protein
MLRCTFNENRFCTNPDKTCDLEPKGFLRCEYQRYDPPILAGRSCSVAIIDDPNICQTSCTKPGPLRKVKADWCTLPGHGDR